MQVTKPGIEKCYLLTLDPTSDVEETILNVKERNIKKAIQTREKRGYFLNLIDPADVSRVQPSLIINGLLGLLLIVQIAHEHMTTVEAHLNGVLLHWK